MNVLSMEELQDLATPKEGKCISIYMPTVEKSEQTRQNPIRFKNLLDEAEDQLREVGVDDTMIEDLFQPAHTLQHDNFFWQHQDEGLAVFLSNDGMRTYRLPLVVQEQVVVNDRFYLKPMLPMLYADDEFYILALSQNEVRMLKASEHSVEEVHPPNLPKSLDELLPDSTPDQQFQFHTGTSQQTGRGQAMYAGHGAGEEDKKDNVRRYFRSVNKAVSDFLKDNKSPLVLAGVEYLLPLYKEANTYQHLADDIIPGNPQLMKAQDLRDEAWKLIKPAYQSTKENIAGQYKYLSGRKDNRAVKDIEEIIKAAPYGRVEVLFVDKNAKKWGTFDENDIKVQFEDDQHPGNQDLLDFAAVQTLLNGGTVFVLDPEELPEQESPAAAIFRY